MTEQTDQPLLKLKVQVLVGNAIAIGPGKADLLDAIESTGSIAAAGRSLGLSYRRTRDMVDTLNACWREPLVCTTKGGRTGGGATLSPAGVEVLQRYRQLDTTLRSTARECADALLALAQPPHS